jgi:hypothetical protein
MKWFRLYHDLPSDRKLIRFSVQQKWAWIVLLCMASESNERGKIVGEDDSDIATEIAMDHLEEYEDYYDSKIGLPNMEKKLEEDKDARGLYNQDQGDEHNPNAGVEILQDWEIVNKIELEVLTRMAQEKNFTAMGNYIEQLKRKGFNQKTTRAGTS